MERRSDWPEQAPVYAGIMIVPLGPKTVIGELMRADSFIFEFSITRTPEYRATYYDPNSLTQIIAEQGLFELVDTEPMKSVPARLYTQWNKHLLYNCEKYILRHMFSIARRYILRKIRS